MFFDAPQRQSQTCVTRLTVRPAPDTISRLPTTFSGPSFCGSTATVTSLKNRVVAMVQLADDLALQPGRSWPMGATYEAGEQGPGVNFAVFSDGVVKGDVKLADVSFAIAKAA